MNFTRDEIYHVYNRGNNKQCIFFEDENYFFFLNLVRKHLSPRCKILNWCLMPDHFHFMIYADQISSAYLPGKAIPIQQLSEGIRLLLSSYTKAINKRYARTGNLFQQKTKSIDISSGGSDYAEILFNYIHNNAVKAGLVSAPEDWVFSSYKDYAGSRKGSLCSKDLTCKLLGIDSNNFVEYSRNYTGDMSGIS